MNQELLVKIERDFEKTVRVHKEDEDTLIGLPNPYTVPSTVKFQEMYYWDTYFANLGLLKLGKIDLAKGNVDNFLFMVEKFGFIPNGSRTFFLSRSQPPFLSRMVRDLYAVIQDKEWLNGAYETLKKEYDFWQTKRMMKNGLNGYCPPITSLEEAGGNAHYFLGRVQREPLGEKNFVPDYPSIEELDEAGRMQLGSASLCFCECGWDYSSRFLDEGHECAAIDLNSLLFDVEENMRAFAEILGNGEGDIWSARKEERRAKMQVLWSEKEELFLDYNVEKETFSGYKSIASAYPMYANIATKEQAESTVRFIESLEAPYGFAAGENKTVWRMQWDFPKVWAPLQVILYDGLKNYGYDELAKKVAQKYIALVEKQYAETGELWEKYDGVTGGHPSSACIMTGWTAGAYLYFLDKV